VRKIISFLPPVRPAAAGFTIHPKPDGPTKGEVVPLKELKKAYYSVMGYDLATGNPPDVLLTKLGIKK
jgi:aldehyde:ferredoxin oxidoreductase